MLFCLPKSNILKNFVKAWEEGGGGGEVEGEGKVQSESRDPIATT